jgi:hypothetical protein
VPDIKDAREAELLPCMQKLLLSNLNVKVKGDERKARKPNLSAQEES